MKASREAVLNRSLELTDARQHTFHNTTAVYDLLTIALVKRAQFNTLSEARCHCTFLTHFTKLQMPVYQACRSARKNGEGGGSRGSIKSPPSVLFPSLLCP